MTDGMQHVRRGVSSASQLAQMQAVPRDHKPCRLPTFPAIERTSLAKLTTTMGLKLSTASDTDFMVFRGLKDCLWRRYTSSDGSLAWNSYYAISGIFGDVPGNPGAEMNLMNIIRDADFGGPAVSGDMLAYPKMIDRAGDVWFYNPSGGTFRVELTFSASVTSGSFDLYLERITGFDTDESRTFRLDTTITGAVITATTTSAGWYKIFKLVNKLGGAPLVVLNRMDFITVKTAGALSAGVGAWLPVLASPPEYSTYQRIYSDSRCNASSFLFQNTTAVLNKEGAVQAVRIPVSGATLFDTAGDTALNSALANNAASERYVGLLEKGFYMFVGPDQRSSNFIDWTNGLFPDSFAFVQIVRFSDYGDSATSMMLSWDFHVEFRNTSMLWDIGIATTTLEEWHRAQIALATIPYFYENIIHLQAIAIAARAAAMRLAPIVAPIARRAGQALITDPSG